MGFTDERELIERALAHGDSADEGDAVFPPVARRFAQARAARSLTIEDLAAQWGPGRAPGSRRASLPCAVAIRTDVHLKNSFAVWPSRLYNPRVSDGTCPSDP